VNFFVNCRYSRDFRIVCPVHAMHRHMHGLSRSSSFGIKPLLVNNERTMSQQFIVLREKLCLHNNYSGNHEDLRIPNCATATTVSVILHLA